MDNRIATAKVSTAGGRASVFFGWAFVTALVALSIHGLKAPRPVSVSAPATYFSAERAIVHVRKIANAPHPMGTVADERVRLYLREELAGAGLNVEILSEIGIMARHDGMTIGDTRDVIGYYPGTASTGAVVLVAHYDSVYLSDGAADDGAAVAAILEAVRAVRAGPPLKNDLIVLFTEGEETGLLGADAFAHSVWIQKARVVLNFEARGGSGPSLLFETSLGNRPLVEAFATSTSHPIGSSVFYSLYRLLPHHTDFNIFRLTPVSGMNFAFGEDLRAYHSQLDNVENLSRASLQHHGEYALDLTRSFGSMDLTRLEKDRTDDIFFNVLGDYMCVYGQTWVIPLQLLVTLTIVIAVGRHWYSSKSRKASLLRALAAAILLTIVVATSMALMALIEIKCFGFSFTHFDSKVSCALLVSLIPVGVLTATAVRSLWKSKIQTAELFLAGLVFVCSLSWALAIVVPGGSYLLSWPLLVASLFAVAPPAQSQSFSLLISFVCVTVTTLLYAPVIYLLYIFFTFTPFAAACIGLLMAIAMLVCYPFFDLVLWQGQQWFVSSSLAFGAFILSICYATVSLHSVEIFQRDSLLYSFNADTQRALWISSDERLDPWTSQFFTDRLPTAVMVPDFLAGDQTPVFSSPAPASPDPAPTAELKSDEPEGSARTIRMHVESIRRASQITMSFDEGAQPTSIRIRQRKVIPTPIHGRYSVVLLGMNSEGSDIAFTFPRSSKIGFWLVDQSYGLPKGAPARPTGVVADGGSDISLISRHYLLFDK